MLTANDAERLWEIKELEFEIGLVRQLVRQNLHEFFNLSGQAARRFAQTNLRRVVALCEQQLRACSALDESDETLAQEIEAARSEARAVLQEARS